MPSTTQQKVI